MYWLTFALLIRAIILSTGMAPQQQYKSTQSGIFAVYDTTDDFSSCHNCLVRSMGILQNRLIKVNGRVRLYWVEGYADITREFVFHCLCKNNCYIHGKELQLKHVDIFSNGGRQQCMDGMDPKSISAENDIYYWIKLMNSQVETTQIHRMENEHLRIVSFIEKQPSMMKVSLSKKNDQEPNLGAIEESAPAQSNLKSSVRCMLIFGRRHDSVCRECLALHSYSLTVWTYHLYYKSKSQSTELCVFFSQHDSTYILEKCRRTFCAGILAWDLADCQKIDAAFPLHRESAGFKRRSLYGKNLLKAWEILASNRMSRASKIRDLSGEVQHKMKGVLRTLSNEKVQCLIVTSIRNRIWNCLSCFFNDYDSSRLVLDLSLTSCIVVTDIVPEHTCDYCKIDNIIQSKKSVDFLHEHKMSSESHHHLVSKSGLVPLEGTCISLHYQNYAKKKCIRCIQKNFVTSEVTDATPFSSLLDATKFSMEKTLESLNKILNFHKILACRKIQMMPQSFCNEHQAFVIVTSSEPQTKFKPSTIHILSEHIMPVGVWPPSSQQTAMDVNTTSSPAFYLTPIGSKSRTHIWPFSNAIGFVEFKSAKSQQLECAICLVQHSEVFFVHLSKDEVSGYVWIRQAPSHILGLCLEKTCTILTYDEKRLQLKRRVGLRQWTATDLKSGNGEACRQCTL